MKDLIVILILFLLLGLAITYIVKKKKSGSKCIGCPDGCCGCSKYCSTKNTGIS